MNWNALKDYFITNYFIKILRITLRVNLLMRANFLSGIVMLKASVSLTMKKVDVTEILKMLS